MKYYVIRKGRNTGIFASRDECKDFVIGVKGAKYKSFKTLPEAQEAFKKGFESYYIKEKWFEKDIPFEKNSIAVDAACSRNPGLTEYQGVDLLTGQQIFHQKLGEGTNNIGEFLALVHGLSYLKNQKSDKSIYSDSKRAIKRVSEKKCKTNLKKTAENLQIFDLIKRAEDWLQNHDYSTKILKWKTEDWGEIPADFGRK